VKSNIRKFRVLGILSLPLAALALAAVLLSMNLGTSSPKASANLTAGVDFHISALSAGGATCTSAGNAKGTCTIGLGSTFTLTAFLDDISGLAGAPPAWDSAYSVTVNYTGVTTKASPGPVAATVPDLCDVSAPASGVGFVNAACVIFPGGGGPVSQTYTGEIWTSTFNCTASGTLSLLHDKANTNINDSGGLHFEGGPDLLNVDCIPATDTPTPTPTSTPPDVPFVRKLPALSNVFLTAQGTKIPPQTCVASTNVATLTEAISGPIATSNPKNELQDLAAFEFEVRFDSKNVCVNLIPSAQWQALVAAGDAVCVVRDKDSSTLEGIAQIGCVTVGKGVNSDGLELATIEVRPSPELYSQIRPNQDNGIVVQILNQGCELADEQGHAVPIFSCEDADITFRYLEGDIGGPGSPSVPQGPNCVVDVFDAQNVAFRWGVHLGSLLYNSFMDLEPSGQVKGDGDIDIKDIQFVFGRFASTCANPWPAQLPANPKGVKP